MGNNGTNTLWYQHGALCWNEALPLGNGRLGAMVYGGAESERICLNEDTLWSGYPGFYDNPGAVESYWPWPDNMRKRRKNWNSTLPRSGPRCICLWAIFG